MSATDTRSNQPVLEEGRAVETARQDSDGEIDSRKLSSKKAEAAETAESVDCFYEHNKNSSDRGSAKPAKP